MIEDLEKIQRTMICCTFFVTNILLKYIFVSIWGTPVQKCKERKKCFIHFEILNQCDGIVASESKGIITARPRPLPRVHSMDLERLVFLYYFYLKQLGFRQRVHPFRKYASRVGFSHRAEAM